ncbi:YitT family protein [Ructibacterium gallinarum]|uniref:YitT family protein n=1 Tax=Ructibacterium gallinarum TaxID=2779355 RepID=A0A9D5M5N5_9FIRM|nr:YitT family protein [Ructibacterium gallinarum]MBE5040009.1 YitT family protein [Ructibacterium gallinarum]
MYGKIKKGFFTILGAAVMGFSLDLFLVPLHIAAGGVSGLATVISYLTGLSVGLLILLINIPIFIVGAINFNRKFLLYSLLGTLSLSISTQAFALMPPLISDLFPASIFGGAGMGLGLGLVLWIGGSTGGTDILAMVLKKRFPRFSLGQFFLLIDGTVIITAGLVFGGWEIILYSSAALFVSSKVIDAVLSGVDYAKMVYIMSENAENIASEIYSRMKRGVTGLQSISMYTGKNKRVLLCVIRKAELPKLKRLVHQTDPESFLIISDAREVLGNGFKGII